MIIAMVSGRLARVNMARVKRCFAQLDATYLNVIRTDY